MAVTLEELIELLEGSGIIASDVLRNFIPPKAFPKDAEELAKELARQTKLTKFQVEEILKGRGKSLSLGNYVLLEQIGAGGMGRVFKAQHRRMDRMVAVKVLSSKTTKNKAAIARFEREVKAVAKFSHPNIVTAHDADQAKGVHFLVMEFVEGHDLATLVRKSGPFTVERAVDCIRQVAKGLEAAHAAGVVHRDIKPANLLLDLKGTVKILDMGLARLSEQEEAPQAELTSTGTVMGTVDYMAPEQAVDAKTADARADVYSLGCVLHYLITGKPPFGGDSPMNRLLAHREKPIPSLRANHPETLESLDTIFRKMLAKKAADRYQTMSELLVALEGVVTEQPKAASVEQLSTTVLYPVDGSGVTVVTTTIADMLKPTLPTSNWKTAIIYGGVSATLVIGLAVAPIVSSSNAKIGKRSVEGAAEAASQEKRPVVEAPVKLLAFQTPAFQHWMNEVAEKPAKQKVEAVVEKLKELNPGYDGYHESGIEFEKLTAFVVFTNNLTDISPVRAFGDLIQLRLEGHYNIKSTFSDLAPLKDMKLSYLWCGNSMVSDLSPLAGMPLKVLSIPNTPVNDLSPIQEMPIENLVCDGCLELSDLSPLKAMPLKRLSFYATNVASLAPLAGKQLTYLDCGGTQVSDLSPLQGMPLTELHIWNTQVSDLSPLKDSPIKGLACHNSQVTDLSPLEQTSLDAVSFSPEKISNGIDVIRHNTHLRTLGADWNNRIPPNEFWKKFDAGEFSKPMSQ